MVVWPLKVCRDLGKGLGGFSPFGGFVTLSIGPLSWFFLGLLGFVKRRELN